MQGKERIAPLLEEGLIYGAMSQPKKSGEGRFSKAQLRLFLKDEQTWLQISYQEGAKAIHENVSMEQAAAHIAQLLETTFHQCQIYTPKGDYHLLQFGKLKIKTQPPSRKEEATPLKEHNVKRQYLLEDGVPCDFLIRLGVMGEDGRVHKKTQDKFRQINKYLELIATAVQTLPENRLVRIVDFGCGKSYLTFALYYYLVQILGRQAEIIGLDLKEDVVAFCEGVARDLGYDGLRFFTGEIKAYETQNPIDMVITLHACDNATDDAIVQAVEWGVKVLLTVPCCQHEFFSQMENAAMEPLLRHGILKERVSALVTDALRCQLLEVCGYQTDAMEFISLEHTPKNILLRALRTGKKNPKAYAAYEMFRDSWSLTPYLEKRLREIGAIE